MEKINLKLSDQDFIRLNALCPPTEKSADIGKRAIEIVKHLYKSKDPNSTFRVPAGGGDIEIQSEGRTFKIEVKGTTETDICWMKLKVSGKLSYELLVQGMPLYRVCGVNDRFPTIYILKYQRDYEMVPEPRWSIHPKRTA